MLWMVNQLQRDELELFEWHAIFISNQIHLDEEEF